jgi:rod shape-determining protein MreC
MESLFSIMINSGSDVINGYIALINVSEENDVLKKQNELLMKEAFRARQLLDENERIKLLCGFRARKNDMETTPARVIGKGFSQNYKVIRAIADAGSSDGIKEGMPVITNYGVVGRVMKTASDVCEIILFIDSRSKISAEISMRGTVGTLVGKDIIKGYGSKFVFWERNPNIREGDMVTTTGYGKTFPRGLEIGTVKSSEIRQAGLYYEVDVAPLVDFSRLEEVLIIKNFSQEVVDSLK